MRLRFLPHSPPQPPSANTTTTPAVLQLWKMLTLLIFPRGANLLQDVKTNNNNHDNRSSNDDDATTTKSTHHTNEVNIKEYSIPIFGIIHSSRMADDVQWPPLPSNQPTNQPFRLAFFACVCVCLALDMDEDTKHEWIPAGTIFTAYFYSDYWNRQCLPIESDHINIICC